MNDEVDRILSAEGSISPSSGFVTSVMQSVQVEAATPPPIPFPWARALPGLAAGCAALVTVVVSVVGGSGADTPLPSLPIDSPLALPSLAASTETIWILVASLLVVAAVGASLRLAESH
jgi:hypothetical protein